MLIFVRLFLLEESPSQVGVETQDHLQAKTLWSVEKGGISSDDNLPPGFEGLQPGNHWRNKLSQLPLIKWRCPPRFEVDDEWRVVAGEESKEVEAQNQREMRVLEAIYPRLSSIPANPSVSVGMEDSLQNDHNTIQIPITPIEDEDAAPDAPLAYMESNTAPMASQPHLLANGTSSSQVSGSTDPHAYKIPETGEDPCVQPDNVAAAHAALTAAMSKNDQGNLIDHNLLIKILNDPQMIEQLVTNHGTASGAQNVPASSIPNMPPTGVQNMPFSSTQNMPSTSTYNFPSSSTIKLPNPSSTPINRRDPPSSHVPRPELISSPATSSRAFFPLSTIGPIPNIQPSVPDIILAPPPSARPPIAKDINYYKSLIQQHGAERQDRLPQFGNQKIGTIQEPLNVAKSRDPKFKIMRPCIYFNSARGCRNGANCAYLHETSSQPRISSVPEVQSTKRMKMDREITGR
ncbi:zinc finger CCCH domain-containing 6 [Olea europaea subsp. europaea]|uniref:Zinc finger CCCH domain-containing 6 n=1 Tax=Olea europaea subsp. europaea TaxID=158383 RepID=A0A8S0UNH7_OLEEU|nr:zinc finger CCCH domain-containing 6 [Olea europaea subsp. europaea]